MQEQREIYFLMPARIENRFIIFGKTVGILEFVLGLVLIVGGGYFVGIRAFGLLNFPTPIRMITFILYLFLTSLLVLDLSGTNEPGWKFVYNVIKYHRNIKIHK